MAFGWLKKAVRAAGRAIATVHHGVTSVVKAGVSLTGKIPLIGPGIHGVLGIAIGPLTFTDAVLKGERIDRALLNDLKDKVSGIKEIAPYAKTVISMIPAIGPGVAGAIAASTALMSGMRIDKALVEGVKSMIPGGALAQTIFSVTQAAVSGANIVTAAGSAALDQLRLPEAAKKGLASALVIAQKAAKGENIPKAALEEGRKQLPPNLQKAYDVGIAIGQGQKLQTVATNAIKNVGPMQLAALAKVGTAQMTKNPFFKAAKGIVQKPQEEGYRIGLGLMAHSGVNESTLTGVRNKLQGPARLGFDIAMASHVGAVNAPPPPPNTSPQKKLAYYASHGLKGAPPLMKKAVATRVAATPSGKAGMTVAVSTMTEETWLQWFVAQIRKGISHVT